MGIVFSASAIAHADAAATELMNAVDGARLASLCAYKSRPRACQSLMQSFRTEITSQSKTHARAAFATVENLSTIAVDKYVQSLYKIGLSELRI
jgi:hypothetical protein